MLFQNFRFVHNCYPRFMTFFQILLRKRSLSQFWSLIFEVLCFGIIILQISYHVILFNSYKIPQIFHGICLGNHVMVFLFGRWCYVTCISPQKSIQGTKSIYKPLVIILNNSLKVNNGTHDILYKNPKPC